MDKEKAEVLATQAREGDTRALDDLCRLCYKDVYTLVRAGVPLDDAEDVTQDIFLQLARSICNFRGESSFGTWFSTIRLNRVADFYRRRERETMAFPQLSEEENGKALYLHSCAQVLQDHSWLEAEDALRLLPARYRVAIELRLLSKMRFSEIGEALGLPSPEAARSMYRRGIAYAVRNLRR